MLTLKLLIEHTHLNKFKNILISILHVVVSFLASWASKANTFVIRRGYKIVKMEGANRSFLHGVQYIILIRKPHKIGLFPNSFNIGD
jgi:hypothetical protein